MPTPPNDDSVNLFKLIADGEWHLYEEVRDRLAEKVPPGRALRKYEERYEYSRRSARGDGPETVRSEDDKIFYGARACAQIAITNWKGKAIMVRGSGAEKEIRFKPGYKPFGMPIEVPDESEESEPEAAPAVEAEKSQEASGVPVVPAEAVAAPEAGPEVAVEPPAGPPLLPQVEIIPEEGLVVDGEPVGWEPEDDEVPFYAGPIRPLTAEEIQDAPRRRITIPAEPAPPPEEDDDQALPVEPGARAPIYARDPAMTALGLPQVDWLCPRCGKQNRGTTCERCGVTPLRAKEAYAAARVTHPKPPPSKALLLPTDDIPASDYNWRPSQPVSKEPDPRRCEECGLLMSDETKHAEWHQRVAQQAEKDKAERAMFADSEIRALIRAEIGGLLDTFQAGMERYLAGQFAQVEAQIRGAEKPKRRWRNER